MAGVPARLELHDPVDLEDPVLSSCWSYGDRLPLHIANQQACRHYYGRTSGRRRPAGAQ